MALIACEMAAAEVARVRKRPPHRSRTGRERRTGESMWGWLFVSPSLLLLLIFVIAPIALALYVSFTKWNGQGGPFSEQAKGVGLDNYRQLLTRQGLARKNFATALRNNFYFVLFVVPIQTVVALTLALILNQRRLRGKSFFRTAFYLPSISSASFPGSKDSPRAISNTCGPSPKPGRKL